jgi:uncharacterized phage protein (TIGR01671 family)
MKQREIKFRAFHKERKEMYNVHGWHSEFIFKDTLDGVGCEGNPDFIENVALMQFTGLHDKNGVEIYEGDKFDGDDEDGSYYVVEWIEEKCCFGVSLYGYNISYGEGSQEIIDNEISCVDRNMIGVEDLVEYEIIGNIHQNPEPL